MANVGPADSYFDKLEKRFEKKVARVVANRAKVMTDVLRYRFPLGDGDGRYPKHGWLNSSTRPSNESYKNWHKVQKNNLRWSIVNDADNRTDHFRYPKLLITGHGWNEDKINSSSHLVNLVRASNGRYFSKQMPNGLGRWIYRQKKNTIKQIKAVVGEI